MAEPKLMDRVKDGALWIRLLHMILFAVIFNIAEIVIAVVVVVQFFFRLFTGKPHERFTGLGAALGLYVREMVEYLTFASDERPYPFGDWPGATKKPAGRTPARKRKTKS